MYEAITTDSLVAYTILIKQFPTDSWHVFDTVSGYEFAAWLVETCIDCFDYKICRVSAS